MKTLPQATSRTSVTMCWTAASFWLLSIRASHLWSREQSKGWGILALFIFHGSHPDLIYNSGDDWWGMLASLLRHRRAALQMFSYVDGWVDRVTRTVTAIRAEQLYPTPTVADTAVSNLLLLYCLIVSMLTYCFYGSKAIAMMARKMEQGASLT